MFRTCCRWAFVGLLFVLAGCGGSSAPEQPATETNSSAGLPSASTDKSAVDSQTGTEEAVPPPLPSNVATSVPGTADRATHAALRDQAGTAMRKAAEFYRRQVASHGGYVYYYAPDLSRRWGEGEATEDQIWVQPPGTPTVGMAYLEAYAATGDEFYREAAIEAARALMYGQLASGGWTNCVDFDPQGKRSAQYRNGKGRGKNYSSLDDGQTQSAIRLLIHVDEALSFKDAEIHEAAQFALDAILAAQFNNGAFPQVWSGPVSPQRVDKANYPDYDWKTEGRIKEYWNMYTLNDNVPGYVAQTLTDAHRIYGDDKYRDALLHLGSFLVLAQMPDPQPAWVQQYNYDMRPIWARKFEPPAISGDESQEVIDTLMQICQASGDTQFLEPIPRALAYLKKSLLPDGRLARYYELKTNKPLYMVRHGDVYELTYDDSKLPKHYGWKTDSRLAELENRYAALQRGAEPASTTTSIADLERDDRQIIAALDDRGCWLSTYGGEPLVGQPKFPLDAPYISSEVFSRNLTTLSEYLTAIRAE